MLRLFKRNPFLQAIIIVVVSVALWLPSFLHPAEAIPYSTSAPLYELLYRWLAPHPLLAVGLAYTLLLIEGGWLNHLLYRHKIIPQNTLLPMLLYVGLMSYGATPLTLTPLLMVNLLVLACIKQLMVPDTLVITFDQLFLSAMLVALATLFYLPSLMLLLPLGIVFMTQQLFRWRHWVMLLLGFMAPYILVVTWFYMTDRLHYTAFLFQGVLSDFGLRHEGVATWGCITQAGLLLLTVVSLFATITNAQEHTTMYRKNITTCCLPMLGSVLMLGYQRVFPVDMQCLAVPAATMIAAFFLSRNPRKKPQQVLLDLMLVLFIVFQF